MLFTSPYFLFYFLPAATALHRFTLFRNRFDYQRLTRITIFLLTLLFYGAKTPWVLIPFGVCVGFDFLWATLLSREVHPTKRKIYLWLSVTQNLFLLGFFKYGLFVVEMLHSFFPGVTAPPFLLTHSLPPGISFYTFESLSFVIDVYRKEVEPPRDPWEFFAFIGMFPRFIAGPIVRYRDMVGQFENYAGMKWETGLFLFSIGFFAKTALADSFSVFVYYAFNNRLTIEAPSAWLGLFCYTMQIYFDFAGYSLMAIGLGKVLGFQFPTNFNKPYQATSLQDFWRGWHISLSTWLRDYLYVALGGSRKGKTRTYISLFLTMLIGGLWHGAGYTFLAWGAWHGVGLAVERAFKKVALPTVFKKAFTFLFVMLGWIFFKASSFTQAATIFKGLFNFTGEFNSAALTVYPVASLFCAAGLFYWLFAEPRWEVSSWEKLETLTDFQRVMAMILFLVGLVLVRSAFNIPFLYFQF